jgi:hypothetical protein
MDELNRSGFTPDEEWHPETLADGRLGPPGRKPPTAIATATPRPPHRPGRYRRLTTLQRIARGMLSVLLVGSGALTTSLFASVVGVVAGTALGGLGAAVAIRLLRRTRALRVDARAQRSSPGDSPEWKARSA